MSDIQENISFENDLKSLVLYANALSSLYGVCPFDLFVQIYERDFPDSKFFKKDIKALLLHVSKILGSFSFKNNMLVAFSINTTLKKYILDDRSMFKPYIPDSKEISEHLRLSEYDEKNPAFKRFLKFLKKELKDDSYAEEAAIDIVSIIKCNIPIKSVVEYIQEEYKIIEEEKSLTSFFSVYTELVNTSHLWSNWGHTPNSLTDERGDMKKEAYSDEFLEKLKQQKENRPHIELLEECIVPTDKEIAETQKAFDEYWTNGKTDPVWHKDGDKVLSRIMKDVKANEDFFSQLPEESMFGLFDQWLASVYHANANRPGTFGNRKWDFCAFEIAEKLRENLFTCLLPNGTPFVLYSSSANSNFEEEAFCILSVLVDMGGWFMSYGPQLAWKGLKPRDLEGLAKSVAPQMFELNGISRVIQFNPVPFWCAYKIANVPAVYHKGKPVTRCLAQTRFLENVKPNFPKEWVHESSKKIERWIFNKEDYLASAAVYYDTKTQEAILYSMDEELFDKAFSDFSTFFDLKCCTVSKMSMQICSLIKDSRAVNQITKFEKAFF